MTTEPLRVEPVEVDYYQDQESSAAARVMRALAIVGIIYGAFDVLHLCAYLAGRIGIGPYSGAGDTWYTTRGIAVLSLLLVLSCIGCLKCKQVARTGIIVYCIAAIGFNLFLSGAYVFAALGRWDYEPIGDLIVYYLGVVSGIIHSSVLPILALIVFRMREVRRQFEKV